MPRVNVVIPAYNAGKFLPLTLEWGLRSTFQDVEFVVVDDGSTDDTAQVAAQFGPRIRVVSQPNAGMSAARNVGIHSGDSEYVALLDADDIWHPGKLEHQVATLENRSEFAFCFTEFVSWDGELPATFPADHVSGVLEASLTGWIYHRLVLTNWVLPSSVMFRRSAWEALGEFVCDDHKTDDWEFLVRASREFQFAKLRDVMVLYRQQPESLSKRVTRENAGEAMRERLLAKYGYASPDGSNVDIVELARRRYCGRRDFADVHCARGDIGIGLREFLHLLASGPRRPETLVCLAKSLRRRLRHG